MDGLYAYTYGTAGWLGLQAGALILLPQLVVGLLAEEIHAPTDLEIYFSRLQGFALLTLSIITLFFTGWSQAVSGDDKEHKASYAVPIVRVTTMFHFLAMGYNYVRYVNGGSTGYMFGALGYGGVAIMGFWCVMFGSSPGHSSKRTGRDKRMSGFPFKNVNEYDKRTDHKMQ